jgi:hypothetical protein
MIDTYTVYCEWLRERKLAEPTREQWDKWCAAPRNLQVRSRDDLEIERDKRENW